MSAAGLFDLLRLGRTAGLRLAEPFDRFRLRAEGRDDLPPLWLRRHAGPIADYERSARAMDGWIGNLELVRAGDCVVDLGCGAGAMAPLLGWRIGPTGRYIGLDVHRPSLAWAARHFAADARFSFDLVTVRSPYGSQRGVLPAPHPLPVADGSGQFLLAKSLFTHLIENETAPYLAEIRRVLEPGRAALVSALLFERGSRADRGLLARFPHPEPGRPVRWRFRHRPQAAVAYERSHFLALAQRAGLRAQWICEGFLPGDDDMQRGQDLVLLGV